MYGDLPHLNKVQILKRHLKVPLSTWESMISTHDEASLRPEDEPVIFNEISSFYRCEQWGPGRKRDSQSHKAAEPKPDLPVTNENFFYTTMPLTCFVNNKLLLPI